MNIKKKYCGQISIIGKTNVGKSTLINQIIGKKIAITSRKKNTTQNNIIGIKTDNSYQAIYMDTPGIIFNKKNNTILYKNNFFYKTINDSELIIFIIDRLCWTQHEENILDTITKNKIPIIIVINKIDKIKNKTILLPFIDLLKKKNINTKIIPISARNVKDTTLLHKIIQSYLPHRPHLYPKHYTTKNSCFFTISEIIREQLISFMGDELPSILKVRIEYFKKQDNQAFYIKAIILVQNIRQKKIVIGHNGEQIKKISIISRCNIEKQFGLKIHLMLWVKLNFKK